MVFCFFICVLSKFRCVLVILLLLLMLIKASQEEQLEMLPHKWKLEHPEAVITNLEQ